MFQLQNYTPPFTYHITLPIRVCDTLTKKYDLVQLCFCGRRLNFRQKFLAFSQFTARQHHSKAHITRSQFQWDQLGKSSLFNYLCLWTSKQVFIILGIHLNENCYKK